MLKELFGLTAEGKVKRANRKVDGAISMFDKIVAKIDSANESLLQAKEQDKEREEELIEEINAVRSNQSKADSSIEKNNRLKENFNNLVK